MWTRARAVSAGSAVLVVVLAGCGDQGAPVTRGEPVPPSSAVPSPTAQVSIVDEKAADLQLWVSNQSFVDDTVQITIAIDGVELVDRPFAVEGQHNWVRFPVALQAGRHEVVAVSDTGVELRESFTIPETGRRHAVIDYWYYPDDKQGRHFTWHIQKDPLAFA